MPKACSDGDGNAEPLIIKAKADFFGVVIEKAKEPPLPIGFLVATPRGVRMFSDIVHAFHECVVKSSTGLR